MIINTINYILQYYLSSVIILISMNIFIIYAFFTHSTIMNNKKKHSIKYVLTALVILSFSTFLPAIASAAPLAPSDKDWQYTHGNSWAWNSNDQTQINNGNVGQVEVK